ncbi:MAG TPA: PAS domain S-box protein, partial [Urbifossiella sp.]|nr:PAS domain S-box protein [Urbifossiella sp.]
MEQAGYAAVVAGTADEVFAALRAGPVALLVVDIGLAEDGDGLDLYARVRAAGFDVPAVLITGRYTEETLIRALRAGVRDVLPRSRSFARHLPGVIGRVVAQSRTARLLADSEARLASVITTARDAILVTDPDFRVGLMNPAAEGMFRCRAGDAPGRPLSDFIPAELLAPAAGGPGATPLPRALREPVLASRADGDRFPAEVSFSRGEASGQAYFTAVVRDVTGRERAAAKIREQAALLDQANDAIVVRRPDGAVAYWNRGAERLYGWTAAEAAGGALAAGLAPAAFLALADAHRELAATGRWAVELRHTRADGQEVVVASRWSVLRGPDRQETGVLVIDSDVTPQKQLEAQYLHAQKMHAVGQLAAGVAHDFNNLLSVVTGSVEILLARPDADADARDLLAAAHRAAAGGAALVRQLLAFSRGHPVAPQLFLLNDVVAGVRQMLPRLVGAHVTVETRLAPES